MHPADFPHLSEHLRVGNMRAVPGQQEVHSMNRGQCNMRRIARRFLRQRAAMNQRFLSAISITLSLIASKANGCNSSIRFLAIIASPVEISSKTISERIFSKSFNQVLHQSCVSFLLPSPDYITTWACDQVAWNGAFKIQFWFQSQLVCLSSISRRCLRGSRPEVSALRRRIPSAVP